MLAVRTTYYNDIVCWISDGCKQKFLDLVNGWIGILIRDKEKRMQNDLLNPNLFGNEAGEDEDKKRLGDYYLEKEKNKIFHDANRKLGFVRARKGVGKSALLNYSAYKVEEKYKNDMVINIKASELIALYECDDYQSLHYINCWQQRICLRILNEIAKKIKFAATDDSMKIIENAEIMGYKGKNIISALSDRIALNLDKKIIQKKNSDKEIANGFEILKRYSEEKDQRVWLFIDDIDATFVNTENNMIMVGTFFTACRYLVNSVSGLNIRASVRTDVWTILRNYDEALDKCEQYMLDLVWSTKDTGEILYNKLYTYFSEEHPELNLGEKNFRDEKSLNDVFNLVFNGQLKWGKNWVIPYRSIHILGAGRPRWAAQLCKIAAKDAFEKQKEKIATGNVNFAMTEYGKFRMADLYKEHRHQCSNLEMIIEIFRNGKKSYSTSKLIEVIKKSLIDNGKKIYIDGLPDECNEVQIGKYLYRIGFITLRNNEYNSALGLTRYEDDPYLFSEYNIDDQQIWEIHPAYRTVLKIR